MKGQGPVDAAGYLIPRLPKDRPLTDPHLAREFIHHDMTQLTHNSSPCHLISSIFFSLVAPYIHCQLWFTDVF